MTCSRAIAVLLLALVGAACGADGGEPAPQGAGAGATAPPPVPSRTADAVRQAAERAEAALARGADPAALSTAVVHVRPDGAVEVVLHTAVAVTGRQLDELRRLGAEIVVTTATPARAGQAPGSLVQAWVPARRIADMEILPWVSAVTAPAYARTDG